MAPSTSFWLKLAALVLTPVVASISISPFSDGQCENSLNGNFTFDDIESAGSFFGVGEGYPHYQSYENVEFTGADAPSNGPGYSVYWHVTDLDPSCRVVFLLPFVEKAYGATSNDAAYGSVIMNVGSEGCFYTNLPVSFLSCCL